MNLAIACRLIGTTTSLHNIYIYIHKWQARHVRTKTELTQKSHVVPGSQQNLVPRLARLALIMGLSAAFVRSLQFIFDCCSLRVCFSPHVRTSVHA